MAPDREGFAAFVEPLARFLDESPDRLPFSDWYDTRTGRVVGFHARPVVGGVFIRLLSDAEVWRSWAGRAPRSEFAWAPLPKPPVLVPIVPTARDGATTWRYTSTRPLDGWTAPAFDDSGWESGPGGFGTKGTPSSEVRTVWDSPAIWLRRTVEVGPLPEGELRLMLHHDEDAEVHIDGVLAVRAGGYSTDYQPVRMRPEALEVLARPGPHGGGVSCRQTGGGQYIDVGVVAVHPGEGGPAR
jgi:hypothetical protein